VTRIRTTNRYATANIQKDAPAHLVRAAIATVARRADVIFWQEIETEAHRDAIDELDELFSTYWPGGSANAVPISVRRSRFDDARTRVLKRRRRKRYLLHKGQAGNTPDRWSTVRVVVDQTTGKRIALQNMHLIQQAFTSKPGNLPEWQDSAEKVSRIARRLVKNHARLVGAGDMNRNRWAPQGTTGHWATHGTYDAWFYDVLFTAGLVQLRTKVGRFDTGLDHEALVVFIEAV